MVISKPNFLYDHKNNKYREFGNDDPNKTILTLPVIAILLSIIIVILFSLKSKENNQIKYIPIQYVPVNPTQMMPNQMIQQINPII